MTANGEKERFQERSTPAHPNTGLIYFRLHSIPGSAVCAFSMADIEKVFWGRFKEQKTQDSVWTPFPEEKLPKPRY